MALGLVFVAWMILGPFIMWFFYPEAGSKEAGDLSVVGPEVVVEEGRFTSSSVVGREAIAIGDDKVGEVDELEALHAVDMNGIGDDEAGIDEEYDYGSDAVEANALANDEAEFDGTDDEEDDYGPDAVEVIRV